ncbi:MAG: sensor histidine kinase [Actinobacteria bacterium]|nr:sensor histidine kinase [Actinomycetota bacterium]
MNHEVSAEPRTRAPLWVANLVAVVVVVMFAFAPSRGGVYDPPTIETLALVAVAAVALPFRRRWPILVLTVVVVLFGVAAAAGVLNAGLALAIGICAFGVTNRRDRRSGVIVTTVTAVVVVALSLMAAIDPRVVQFALVVLVGAALGDATRSRRAYIVAVTERAERAEQTREAEAQRRVSEERLKIARDLHDAVAHQIAVISLNAGVASSAIDTRPEKAQEALATIRSAARTVLGEIGGLLEVLRAADDDPAAAPQPGLDRVDALAAQFAESGPDVTVRVEGDLSDVPEAIGRVAYRVVQEALTNAHKHGAERRAHVLLAVADGTLTITVTNPVGPDAGAPGSRLGLTGLRERVATVRGSVQAGPAPGGWRVTARLPLTMNLALSTEDSA